MDLDFLSIRRVLLASMGLVAGACGPGPGPSETTSDETTTGASATHDASSTSVGTSASSSSTTDATTDDSDTDTPGPLCEPGGELSGSYCCDGGLGEGCLSAPPPCDDPQPILQAGGDNTTPSGWVLCADGTKRREQAVACVVKGGKDYSCRDNLDYDYENVCGASMDCPEGQVCRRLPSQKEDGCTNYCGCDDIGCVTDDDCAPDEMCLCAGVYEENSPSLCVKSNCRSNADCAGFGCALADIHPSTTTTPRAGCFTPDDSCHVTDDCLCYGTGTSCSSTTNGWSCDTNCSQCGRPFIVDGHARVAELLVDDATGKRERVALYYQQLALYEHASIASFYRFALELMGVGAPPSLIREAVASAEDERRHARSCLEIAARFGSAARLGAIDTRVPARRGVVEIIAALVREGCIGETVAALELEVAVRGCRDAKLRDALASIAEDELRHAQFAWRCLTWLIRAYGPRAYETALATATVELRRLVAQAPGGAPSLERFGVLSPSDGLAVRRAVARDVVTPCLAAVARASQPSPAASARSDLFARAAPS